MFLPVITIIYFQEKLGSDFLKLKGVFKQTKSFQKIAPSGHLYLSISLFFSHLFYEDCTLNRIYIMYIPWVFKSRISFMGERKYFFFKY